MALDRPLIPSKKQQLFAMTMSPFTPLLAQPMLPSSIKTVDWSTKKTTTKHSHVTPPDAQWIKDGPEIHVLHVDGGNNAVLNRSDIEICIEKYKRHTGPRVERIEEFLLWVDALIGWRVSSTRLLIECYAIRYRYHTYKVLFQARHQKEPVVGISKQPPFEFRRGEVKNYLNKKQDIFLFLSPYNTPL